MCVINDVSYLMGCAGIITLITLNHALFSPSRPFYGATRKCNHSCTPQKQILLYARTGEGFDKYLAGQYPFRFLERLPQASIVRVSGRLLGTIVGDIRSNLRHLSR